MPDCVTEQDFEGSRAQVMQETVSLGKSTGLDIEGADTGELVEGHKEELMMEELAELQREQQEVLEEQAPRKRRV